MFLFINQARIPYRLQWRVTKEADCKVKRAGWQVIDSTFSVVRKVVHEDGPGSRFVYAIRRAVTGFQALFKGWPGMLPMRASIVVLTAAVASLLPAAAQLSQFLPADRAFAFEYAWSDAQTLALRWNIAEGYYLYREQMELASDHFLVPALPDGVEKTDKYFGHKSGVLRSARIAPAAERFPSSRAGIGADLAGLCRSRAVLSAAEPHTGPVPPRTGSACRDRRCCAATCTKCRACRG